MRILNRFDRRLICFRRLSLLIRFDRCLIGFRRLSLLNHRAVRHHTGRYAPHALYALYAPYALSEGFKGALRAELAQISMDFSSISWKHSDSPDSVDSVLVFNNFPGTL